MSKVIESGEDNMMREASLQGNHGKGPFCLSSGFGRGMVRQLCNAAKAARGITLHLWIASCHLWVLVVALCTIKHQGVGSGRGFLAWSLLRNWDFLDVFWYCNTYVLARPFTKKNPGKVEETLIHCSTHVRRMPKGQNLAEAEKYCLDRFLFILES